MLISVAEIPKYLHGSELYRSLEHSDLGTFEIPPNCLKSNCDVISSEELIELLHTVRFWSLDDFPSEIGRYLLLENTFSQNEEKELVAEFPEFRKKFDGPLKIRRASSESKILLAIEMSMELDIVRLLLHSRCSDLTPAMCSCAASFGRLDCLQFLHEQGCPWDAETTSAALIKGSMECYRYAESRGCPVCALMVTTDTIFT